VDFFLRMWVCSLLLSLLCTYLGHQCEIIKKMPSILNFLLGADIRCFPHLLGTPCKRTNVVIVDIHLSPGLSIYKE
jgi:hypothetical protein